MCASHTFSANVPDMIPPPERPNRPRYLRLSPRDASIGTWTTLAESACWTRPLRSSAHSGPDRLHRGLQGAKFTATILSGVRRRGWAQSVAEREPGVASVSAPVRGPSGRVVAAVSISGPVERLTRQPGRLHAGSVVAAANRLTEVLRRTAE